MCESWEFDSLFEKPVKIDSKSASLSENYNLKLFNSLNHFLKKFSLLTPSPSLNDFLQTNGVPLQNSEKTCMVHLRMMYMCETCAIVCHS